MPLQPRATLSAIGVWTGWSRKLSISSAAAYRSSFLTSSVQSEAQRMSTSRMAPGSLPAAGAAAAGTGPAAAAPDAAPGSEGAAGLPLGAACPSASLAGSCGATACQRE